MIRSIISTWHIMAAHFAASIPLFASILIIVGVIAKILKYNDFAIKLTKPIHTVLIFSLISILLACAGALIDFPPGTFIASPFFRIKTILAVTVFSIYSVIYFMFLIREEEIWTRNISLGYTLILSIIGGALIILLGSIGGLLSTGHTVLEGILKLLGFPI